MLYSSQSIAEESVIYATTQGAKQSPPPPQEASSTRSRHAPGTAGGVQRLQGLETVVNRAPPVERLAAMQSDLNEQTSLPSSLDRTEQLERTMTEGDRTRLNAIHTDLDHFLDVLSYSSSIPPRLPPAFFPLFDACEAAHDGIAETKEIESQEQLTRLEMDVAHLNEMMREAKQRAAVDREATEPGAYRPPALLPRRPETAATRAKMAAQAQNEHLAQATQHEDNLEILRASKDAVFYVMGASAMGQGDTAFIVRTVSLLKGLGLTAFGVKAERSAHDVGKSFNPAQFMTRAKMLEMIKPTDFVIEGPLSDPVSLENTALRTQVDMMRRENPALAEVRNLRLYEYGTLDHKGSQLQQLESAKATGTPAYNANVVHSATDPRHAFMGMGHGEIGAFYNAKVASGPVDLPAILTEFAPTHPTCARILQRIQNAPKIYLGYANQIESVRGWVSAVSVHVAATGEDALIIGLCGSTRAAASFTINDRSEHSPAPSPEADKVAIIISDSIPAPVMNALQSVAQPFTLATGNFSLSEAIENGHFPIYETLNFNVGVEVAFVGQVKNALQALQLVDTPFGKAVERLLGAGPATLVSTGKIERSTATDAIGVVLAHPHDVKMLMAVIKANTDITPGLVARLAGLMRR